MIRSHKVTHRQGRAKTKPISALPTRGPSSNAMGGKRISGIVKNKDDFTEWCETNLAKGFFHGSQDIIQH